MASRKLRDLSISVASKAIQVLSGCADRQVELLIYCTYRTVEEQSRLYRNGRGILAIESKAKQLSDKYNRPDLGELLIRVGPQFGERIVTYAGPGQSMHNYRAAFDAVPVVDGKLQWSPDAVEWQIYGNVCAEVGLEWAGTWSIKKREYPHAQVLGVSWRDLIEDYDHDRKD